MPIYNNPYMAEAAKNLASLFAPPSASDAAAGALAGARQADMNRRGQVFDYATDPNFNQERFDRMGVGAGIYAPNQSYYAVNKDDATKRYGYDTQAATSRANNVRDNQTKAIGTLFGPLDPGQVAPAVPQGFMDALQLPELAARQGGSKPLSETEVKGGIIQGLDPDLQEAIAFGSTPVENVVTPEGPRIATRLDAVGREPFVKGDPPGMSITLPDGTVVQQGGKLTEAQSKLVNFGATAETMLPVLDNLSDALTSLPSNLSTNVPVVGNYAQSEDYQKARVVGERFVQAILRNESGAATPDAEIAKYEATMLPKPGDKPGTIRYKSWLRKVAVEALKGGMTVDARKAQIDAAIAAGPPPDFEADTAAGGSAAAAAAAAPAASGAASGAAGTPDGTIIENDAGERMIRRNGTWEPYDGR